MSQNYTKSVVVRLRLTDDEYGYMKASAARLGLSYSSFWRMLLHEDKNRKEEAGK